MRLSQESTARRLGILAPLWVVLAILLFVHATQIRDYLAIAGSLGLRGAPEASTPLRATYPGFAADAQTWVRHALALLEGHDVRLRHTDIDNAPFGREVHWNSPWAWAIAGAGKLDQWVRGGPIETAVERMTIWLQPVTLCLLMIGLSWWAAGRGGVMVGVVVAMAMVGHPRIYEGFFPSYVDHHGLITTAVFATVLGACYMGAGWWRPQSEKGPAMLPISLEQARSAAIFSGLAGAAGLWVGAASVIPTIAFVGLAGIIAVVVRGRAALIAGDKFDGNIWRVWGRAGAAGSLVAYLLEYAPSNFGLRLEVNHPFYALAWLGGGELIATVSEWWLGGCNTRTIRWPNVAWATAAVLVAPATIVIGGTAVFIVSDPFLANLHKIHIQEFLPLWKTLSRSGWQAFFEIAVFDNLPLIVGLGLVLAIGRRLPPFVWFCVSVALFAMTLAWWQSRWLLNASGPQVCIAIGLLAYFFAKSKTSLRWGAALVVCCSLYGYTAVRRVQIGKQDVANRRVSPGDALPALLRDVARVIRASQPTGDIVLVSSPNSSTGIGYFGRFKTLGTLYWENNEGLKAAGRILAARSADEAEKLIRERKVTHIAIVSEENFVGPYFQLLNPTAPVEQVTKTFGHQLLVDKVVPFWLRTIPYRVPDDLKALNISVLLMQVAFGQTPADALYHIALTKIEMGDVAQAEADLRELTKLAPLAPQPWLRLADIMLARQAWTDAVELTINGIRLTAAQEQIGLYSNAAASFYRLKRPVEAVRLYRAALSTSFSPDLASYLGWVLATTSINELRDGKEALEWANKALEKDPNSPTYLNTKAAALAETGKFAEAVEVAQRALANAKLLNDEQTIRVTANRVAAYSQGKVWRE